MSDSTENIKYKVGSQYKGKCFKCKRMGDEDNVRTYTIQKLTPVISKKQKPRNTYSATGNCPVCEGKISSFISKKNVD